MGDIAVRNKVSNVFPLRILLKKIAESIGQSVSYSRLTNIVTSCGVKIAKNTCINYVQYTIDSCLIFSVKNIVGKLQDREGKQKFFFVDNGIVELLNTDPTADQLENLVAIELRRRYGDDDAVFFYQRDVEVDFYVPKTQVAIQVCVRLDLDPKTMRRELSAFEKMSKELPITRRIVITLDEEKTIETDTDLIEIIPIWKWLLMCDRVL